MKNRLPYKNKEKESKNKQFKFLVNPNRLTKKSRKVIELEQSVYELIRINNPSIKSGYRGGCIDVSLYCKLVEVDSLLFNTYEDYNCSWYVNSQVFSYIHDVCSTVTPPDYSIKKVVSLSKYVNNLTNVLIDYSRSIGIKRISRKKHKAIAEWFIVYLDRMRKHSLLALKYPRSESFRQDFNVSNKQFSYNILVRLVDFLIKEKMCIHFKGNVLYGTRPMSMLVINPMIFDMIGLSDDVLIEIVTVPKTPVVVEDCERNIIEFNELGEEIMRLVEQGATIFDTYQSVMSKTKIEVNGYMIPEYWLQRILKIEKETCGRVFDNGSIQGKSKLVRSLIVIDEEETVSLDFKAIHPAMLLHLVGYSLSDHDPYPKLKSIKVNTKLINKFKNFYDIGKYNPVRNVVKKLFLCMINADSINKAVGSCYDDLKKDNLKKGTFHEHTMKYVGLPEINLHEVAKEILKHNHMIAKFLGVGKGNELQFKDSSIIMLCLEELSKRDIPVIPIHDALICKKSDVRYVEDCMAKYFVQVVGEGSEGCCIIEQE